MSALLEETSHIFHDHFLHCRPQCHLERVVRTGDHAPSETNPSSVFEYFVDQLCSIFRIISSVNWEHLAEPPKSPVITFPSLITCKRNIFEIDSWSPAKENITIDSCSLQKILSGLSLPTDEIYIKRNWFD